MANIYNWQWHNGEKLEHCFNVISSLPSAFFFCQTKTLFFRLLPPSKILAHFSISVLRRAFRLTYIHSIYIRRSLSPTRREPEKNEWMTRQTTNWRQCYVSLFTCCRCTCLRVSITIHWFVLNSPSNCTYYCIKLKVQSFY